MKTETTVGLAVILASAGIACSHAQTPPPATHPPLAAVAPTPVTAPKPEPVAPAPAATRDDEDAIYFNYDVALIRDDARSILQQVARRLQLYPTKVVRIEGNCDERGTTEYNLALGDRRANAAKQYLIRLGVPARRIEVVSYGSERPKNSAHDESAWAVNRRDDFRLR